MPLEGAKLRKGSSALMRHSIAQPSTVGSCCASLGSCTNFLAYSGARTGSRPVH